MTPEARDLIKRRMHVVNELLDKSIQELFDDRETDQSVQDAYWMLGDAKGSVEKGVTRLLERPVQTG